MCWDGGCARNSRRTASSSIGSWTRSPGAGRRAPSRLGSPRAAGPATSRARSGRPGDADAGGPIGDGSLAVAGVVGRRGGGSLARMAAGSSVAWSLQPAQQRKTGRPSSSTLNGTPMSPRGSLVTGQTFCARAISASPSGSWLMISTCSAVRSTSVSAPSSSIPPLSAAAGAASSSTPCCCEEHPARTEQVRARTLNGAIQRRRRFME